MNWVAMARRLLVGADGGRNETLTLLVSALLLLPGAASAFDGSISLELSGGNRTLSASLIGDWGIVPDKLYLVASYGVIRQARDPDYASQPTHLFGLGLDWLPTSRLMSSFSLTFSPKATDSAQGDRGLVGLSSTRRSVSGLLALGYHSNGLGDVEWGLDANASGAWYELDTHAFGPRVTFDKKTNLFVVKPSAGAMLSFFGRTDLSLRGTYSWYSEDPTTAGGATNPRLAELGVVQALNQSVSFSAAPPLFDVRVSVLQRIGTRVTGRFGYTFMRYANGLGNAHQLSTRWTVKVTGWARLWAGVSVQYDQLTTTPSFWSGYGTLGAELATE